VVQNCLTLSVQRHFAIEKNMFFEKNHALAALTSHQTSMTATILRLGLLFLRYKSKVIL
jgi:hypothetical protein